METDLIKRQSVFDMAAAYELAVANVKKTHELLTGAEERLQLAFTDRPGFGVFGHGSHRWEMEEILKELKRETWQAVVQQMQITRMMSTQRREELERDISAGNLPEITVDNVYATCQGLLDNMHDYLNEAVAEVFEILRPHYSNLKTNTQFEVGRKVILHMIDSNSWNSKPHPRYRSEQDMRNLDNVFSLLDGKGSIKTYGGPIVDAIKSMATFGDIKETDYFRLRACRNGNLHVEFKRMDLVKKLNEVAGGNRLRKAG